MTHAIAFLIVHHHHYHQNSGGIHGWTVARLAVDAAGYPYPISAQDHEQMYEEA